MNMLKFYISAYNITFRQVSLYLSFLFMIMDLLAGNMVCAQTSSKTSDLSLSRSSSNKFSTVKDIDGNIYLTVQIGDQTWLAQNLRVSRFRDGHAINHVADSIQWFKTKEHAWRNFQNKSVYDSALGKFYNWAAVSDPRGLCPAGWHVPSLKEYDKLILFSGGYKHAGGKLKVRGSRYWKIPNSGATNTSGFSALGGQSFLGSYDELTLGLTGEWWTSTPFNDDNINVIILTHENSSASISKGSKSHGFSVRCIKDQ